MNMSPHCFTKKDFRRAQAKVPKFAARARALLADGFAEPLSVASALGAITVDHLRAEHLDAVWIYPAPTGGYHADLFFDPVPLGLADTVGSTTPEPTSAAAEEHAVHLLATLLHRQSERPKPPPASDHVIFEFHGFEFHVPVQHVAIEVCTGGSDLAPTIRGRLDAFVADRLQGEVTAAALEQLPLEHWEVLYQLVCCALGARIIRHPIPMPQAPGGPPIAGSC
jgi:hypothetical protein